MKNFNLFFKKSFISFLCLSILLASFPVRVFAQTTATGNSGGGARDTSQMSISEMKAYKAQLETENAALKKNNAAREEALFNPGARTAGTPGGGGAVKENDPSKGGLIPTQQSTQADTKESKALTDIVSCSIGAIIANVINGVIKNFIDRIAGNKPDEVPTKEAPHRAKEIGSLVVYGIPILPSWDAIAYCLANAIITYVADSTIEWIQSGFKGKPAFVDDPTKLFNDIADYEMSNFLESLGGGFLCEPFSPYINLSLVENYTQDYSTRGRCTLDTVQGNVDSLLNGDSFQYNTWFDMTQKPANNPYDSYLMAQDEARNRIQLGIGPLRTELDWGNGYFSWKEKDGPNAGKTVTPGQVIQTQLEKRLNLAPDRLVLAEKFDQVISTLVNYLIKTALTETLGAIKKNTNKSKTY